jgi:hypothetical protein
VLELGKAELEQHNARFCVFVKCFKFSGGRRRKREVVEAGIFHNRFIKQGILWRELQ